MSLRETVIGVRQRQKNYSLPILSLGDTVRVGILIEEANKQRVQVYQGTLISKNQSDIDTTIVIRRIFQGVGIERVFFLRSPLVRYVTVLRRAKVRRAKLYYLRYLTGKATRLKERFVKLLNFEITFLVFVLHFNVNRSNYINLEVSFLQT
jgi:large subunit ribosomal protein L19